MNGEDGLNPDRVLGLIRSVLQVVGPMVVALGFLEADQMSQITAVILQVAGGIATLAGIIWTWQSNSKRSIAGSVAAMPETKVESRKDGTAVVHILDPVLAQQTLHAATPSTYRTSDQ